MCLGGRDACEGGGKSVYNLWKAKKSLSSDRYVGENNEHNMSPGYKGRLGGWLYLNSKREERRSENIP